MTEMAERIGRAVLAELGIEHGSVLPRDVGITALAAMREPTAAMEEAGDEDIDFHWDHGGMDDGAGASAWRAMIEAAKK